MRYLYRYETAYGRLAIAENGESITEMWLDLGEEQTPLGAEYEEKETALLKKAGKQMQEYFLGERKSFDLPLDPQGTEFQKKVWLALQQIPYGETVSYKKIAEKINNPKGCRAVGMANNRNPIPFVIPCHRVVGSGGSLVGYAMGLEIKAKLLDMEQKHK